MLSTIITATAPSPSASASTPCSGSFVYPPMMTSSPSKPLTGWTISPSSSKAPVSFFSLSLSVPLQNLCFSEHWCVAEQDKVSEFMTKDIDVVDQEPLLHISEAEYHAILETENHAILKMPSVVFARICSELADVGDSGSYYSSFLFHVLLWFLLILSLCN